LGIEDQPNEDGGWAEVVVGIGIGIGMDAVRSFNSARVGIWGNAAGGFASRERV